METMRIELCIPAFNEERIIAEAARAVLQLLQAAGKDAIVTVSDNASTDGTARTAAEVAGVMVYSIATRGKGAAVVAAARRSEADVFGFIDADLSADPREITALLPFVENGAYDIVIGSRFIDTRKVRRGMLRTALSRMFNLVRKMIIGIKAEDTQCGLKLMNARGREVLARCTETGWFFDMEFLARAERAGLRIHEMPVSWDEERMHGRSSKLNHLRDSVGALRAMLRIRRMMRVK